MYKCMKLSVCIRIIGAIPSSFSSEDKLVKRISQVKTKGTFEEGFRPVDNSYFRSVRGLRRRVFFSMALYLKKLCLYLHPLLSENQIINS